MGTRRRLTEQFPDLMRDIEQITEGRTTIDPDLVTSSLSALPQDSVMAL